MKFLVSFRAEPGHFSIWPRMGFFFVLLPHFYRVFLFRLFFSLFPTGMGPFTTAPPVVGGAQQPQSPPPLLLPCFLLDFTGFSTEFHEVLSRVCPVAAETLRSVFDDAPSRSIRIRRCFFFVSFFFKSISRDSYRVFFFFYRVSAGDVARSIDTALFLSIYRSRRVCLRF